MASRYFHVPARYQAYADLSPSVVLHQIKTELLQKYKNVAAGQGTIGSGSRAEAAKLQTFFQDIKTLSATSFADPVSNLSKSIMMDIINSATSSGRYRTEGQLYHQFFRNITGSGQERGAYFERELAAIVNATIYTANVSGTPAVSNKNLVTGSVQTNIGGVKKAALSSIVNDYAQEFINSADKKLQSVGQQFMRQKSKYITKAVSMKTDVTGLTTTLNLSATADPELAYIATLLHEATFSAKSYASVVQETIQLFASAYDSFKMTMSKFRTATKYNSLALGMTQENRIILDILSTKYDYPVAISMYAALLQTHNKDLQQDITALRFIYELTGYGQNIMNNDKLAQLFQQHSELGAKYLIYNDPATNNIYVRSTADIITEAAKHFGDFISKHNTTSISKLIASSGGQTY